MEDNLASNIIGALVMKLSDAVGVCSLFWVGIDVHPLLIHVHPPLYQASFPHFYRYVYPRRASLFKI